MRIQLALTSSCLPLFIVADQNWKHIPSLGIGAYRVESNKSTTELHSSYDVKTSVMHDRWLMAEKSLRMMEKMMDPNIIYYYIINCAIPPIITIENRYQIDFGKSWLIDWLIDWFIYWFIDVLIVYLSWVLKTMR